MRCDDDYAWGGGNLHGPYDPDMTSKSLCLDFLRFCVLAARRNVVPEGWNWSAYLSAAVKYVLFAFEKSDAQERWGGENIFAGLTGGRSLRHTGTVIYGKGVQAFEVSHTPFVHSRTLRTRTTLFPFSLSDYHLSLSRMPWTI